MRFRPFATKTEWAQALAGHIIACCPVNATRPSQVFLSGGRSPTLLYQKLGAASCRAPIRFIPTDERQVALDHPDSNFTQMKEGMSLTSDSPWQLCSLVNSKGQLPASFEMDSHIDVVVLGMGEDGHVASLFPETTATLERQVTKQPLALYESACQTAPHRRFGLGYEDICRAKVLCLLIKGEEKKRLLFDQKKGLSARLPIGKILAKRADIQVFWTGES